MKLNKNIQLDRKQRLNCLSEPVEWDLIIVGGGITGAGILKLASQVGLKVLLLEQKDFSWGSSSRSSKMVHGGLRYIAEGQMSLTKESVHERQRLLNDAPGLVTQQSFVMSHYKNQFPKPWMFNLLLWLYDFFSKKKQHSFWPKNNYQLLVPGVKVEKLIGGSQFADAMTDDARLVMRLIQEAQQKSALAVNYIKVVELQKEQGRVVGLTAEQQDPLSESAIKKPQKFKLKAKIVVNATGAWSNELLSGDERAVQLRPLRGSHIIVASWRLPVASAVMMMHPKDKRPVIIFPWQNVTVIGTTDVEHHQLLSLEPRISQPEFDYLLAAVGHQFPQAKILKQEVISTFAGVRPVIDSGNGATPSEESREHFINHSAGLINIAGGKLTTFHLIAKQVLKQLVNEIKLDQAMLKNEFNFPVFEAFTNLQQKEVPDYIVEHIEACHGLIAKEFIEQSQLELLAPIAYSQHLWAELFWAVKYEQVIHLDDLLLRRTRIGLLLPKGGLHEMDKIKETCSEFLVWDEKKWSQEISRYKKLWNECYSLPLEK